MESSRTTKIQNIYQHTLSRSSETRWNSLLDAFKQSSNIGEKMYPLTNPIEDSEFENLQ